MDSDQDSSASDDWVVLDSDSDDGVIALSSGCATPCSSPSPFPSSSPDSDAAALLAAAASAAAAADDDDAEGLYPLSDAEDPNPPSPPHPKPLSGLFHHTLAGSVTYAPFDPAALPGGQDDAHHHGFKELVPDPTFSSLVHEPVAVLASTRGLVCLRGEASQAYYVANPATFKQAQLPAPHLDHFATGRDERPPAVVITFDDDLLDDNPDDNPDDRRSVVVYRHYRVVVAFHVEDGIYAFETFSSRTWVWSIGTGIAAAETVVAASGVGVLGRAFWRTTMGFFLCYDPVSGCADLIPAPQEATHWPYWELCEMEGALCAACMDDRVTAVVVVAIDLARRRDARDGSAVAWNLVGHFEGGPLRGRPDVTLLRSQGKAEVVMWDRRAEMVVAMDLEGRTTRTITFVPPGTGYYADFVPYVSSLAAISASEATATNEVGAEHNAMAVDAGAYLRCNS